MVAIILHNTVGYVIDGGYIKKLLQCLIFLGDLFCKLLLSYLLHQGHVCLNSVMCVILIHEVNLPINQTVQKRFLGTVGDFGINKLYY